MQKIRIRTQTHHHVVGLDVSVNVISFVHELKAL